jgi:D-tyrosyl-tRNA(Tyr) deacylase
MRVLIQRVTKASVTIEGKIKSAIGHGLLVLLGIEEADNRQDIDFLVKKTVNLRIFNDEAGVMNRSVLDVGGEILCVSQFTLYASTAKGNRPSYIRAAKPEIAIPLYEQFCQSLSLALNKPVQTGTFGADMQVELLNDGPVTIWIDSKSLAKQ